MSTIAAPLPRRILLIGLAVALTAIAAVPEIRSGAAPQRARLSVCFAPGTPLESVDAMKAEIALFQADDDARWSFTATDRTLLGRGQPTTLTWSIVPDGTSIPGYVGEAAANSNLRSWLNTRYGAEDNWLRLFQDVFDRWSAVSGITYVYEARDDGQTLARSSGSLGVRGDIRIGGHRIDGNSGTLAYNFFPDDGDMVIDTSDSFFSNTANDSLRLRNVIAHEHGHGLGLDHVCPVSGTKLMEPTASGTLDGPQIDDILAIQRLYGDRFESTSTADTPADIGILLPGETILDEVSIDGSNDVDLYSFALPAATRLDVVLSPTGSTYDEAPQNSNGSCGRGSSFDPSRRVDLRLDVLRPDAQSILAASDASPSGGVERILELALTESGRHFVRVRGSGEDAVQLYRLQLTVTDTALAPTAVADSVTTPEDVPITLDVLVNDTQIADRRVFVELGARPSNGVSESRGSGLVRYVPRRDFAGRDAFTYVLRDDRGNRSETTVTVDVIASRYAGDARFDTDRDLYPDELETLVGSAVDDAASRPAAGTPGKLHASRASALVRFRKTSRDAFILRGVIPAGTAFERAGAEISVYVGGVFRRFTLDAKGRSKVDRDTLRIARPGDAGSTFWLRLKRADLVAPWMDEGIELEAGVKREYRELSAFVVVGEAAFETALPLVYTVRSRRGKTSLLVD